MDVKLVVVGGDVRPSEISVRLPLVFGRGREAGILLPHALVSRRHCELVESEGCVVVRDLGSLNGTYVGSERVQEKELASGDLLTIGTVTFRIVYGDQAEFAEHPPGFSDTSSFVANDDSSIFTVHDVDEGASTFEGTNVQVTQYLDESDQADDV